MKLHSYLFPFALRILWNLVFRYVCQVHAAANRFPPEENPLNRIAEAAGVSSPNVEPALWIIGHIPSGNLT